MPDSDRLRPSPRGVSGLIGAGEKPTVRKSLIVATCWGVEMTPSKFDTERHSQTCIMRHRLRAVSALLFSIAMSVACWRELGRAFPRPPDDLLVTAGIPAFMAVAVYFFVAIKCVWERLWFGPVAMYLVISASEAFEPRLVSPVIGSLRIASLALWAWATVIGVTFVWSAFAGNRAKASKGSPPAGSGIG
jgi:hypothetical protein